MISKLRRPLTGLVTLAAAASLGLVGSTPTASAQTADWFHGGACRNGYVGLTFDDGPSPTTPALLRALKEAHLRATMFNVGSNARQYPDLVRAQLRAGMWVGNHSYTHAHLTQIGEPAAFQEIASTQETLRLITGRRPVLFRPPFGETNDAVRSDESWLRLLEVLWTVDSGDWNGATVDEIVAAAHTLEPGGIILMHDWPEATIDAVPRIARDLRARGLCPGRIAYTRKDISGVGTVFHAVAVKPWHRHHHQRHH